MAPVLETLDRLPPVDLDAEHKVLASVLIDPSRFAAVAEILTATDFYDVHHQRIFRAMEKLHRANNPIDVTLLVGAMRDDGTLSQLGTRRDGQDADAAGLAFVREIVATVPSAAHAVHFARLVKDKSIRRRALGVGVELLSAVHNGHTTGELIASATRTLSNLKESTSEDREFQTYTCADLATTDFGVDYFIPGLFVGGQPMVLAGAKKSLKTTLAIELAVSLAMADKFLGKFQAARACNVTLFSAESGLATIKETITRVAESKGLALDQITGLHVADQVPAFENATAQSKFRQTLTGNGSEIAIIDPAFMAMSGEHAGNLFVQGAILREFNQVCSEVGATLVLLHHTRKNSANPFQPPELEDIAWSGFQEWARQWWLIGRREPYEQGSGEHLLWLTVGGSAGHSGLWALDINEGTNDASAGRQWGVTVSNAPDAREAAQDRQQIEREQQRTEKVERDAQKLVETIAKFPDGETVRTLKARLGMNASRFDPALAELLDSGRVESCEVLKSNRRTAYPGYRLTDSETLQNDL